MHYYSGQQKAKKGRTSTIRYGMLEQWQEQPFGLKKRMAARRKNGLADRFKEGDRLYGGTLA